MTTTTAPSQRTQTRIANLGPGLEVHISGTWHPVTARCTRAMRGGLVDIHLDAGLYRAHGDATINTRPGATLAPIVDSVVADKHTVTATEIDDDLIGLSDSVARALDPVADDIMVEIHSGDGVTVHTASRFGFTLRHAEWPLDINEGNEIIVTTTVGARRVTITTGDAR